MHTTHYEGSKVRFHHNGDYSGDVIIHEDETGNEIRCSMEELERFVGDKIKDKLIALIEQLKI